MADQEWGRAVVVRSSPRHNNGTLSVTSVPASTFAQTTSDGAVIPGTPLIPCDRHSLLPPASLTEALIGRDIADTFWKPDATKGEKGLLETLYIRTAANTTYLLVNTRPDAELCRNFSTPDGKLFSLQHNMFKLSKTALAFGQLERMDDDLTMRGRDVKDGLRQGLPSLQQDDFYLVRYRDYSSFAVKQYSEDAKRDTFMGPRYVERCFAVRVGQNSGVFIPISEAQLIFGWELLQKQRLEMPPSLAQNTFALNADQFRSLGVIVTDEELAASRTGSNARLRGAAAGGGDGAESAYVPPHPWDWTPAAIQKRWTHYLEQKYRSVGRFVVQAVVAGVCLYVAYSYARRALGFSDVPQLPPARGRGSRSARRGHADAYYDGDHGSSGVIPAILSGVGLKGLFDVLLAPSRD